MAGHCWEGLVREVIVVSKLQNLLVNVCQSPGMTWEKSAADTSSQHEWELTSTADDSCWVVELFLAEFRDFKKLLRANHQSVAADELL
jgi:hypothetical protein